MDTTWEDAGGRFTVGHGLEIDALREAGIEEADVFIASTDGDNTNLTIAQIAAKQFEVPKVIVRVMDPARAEWYAEQGLHTICPTRYAIEMFERALGGASRCTSSSPEPARSAGTSPASSSPRATRSRVIESERSRYLTIEQELEHADPVRRRHRAVGPRARRASTAPT